MVSRIAKVVAVDGAVVSPGRQHGNPMILDRGEAARTRDAVDLKATHLASNVCQVKMSPFIAGSRDPLVLGRKSLKNDFLVSRIGYWLAHDLETFAIVVHAVDTIVVIIAGLHLGVVQLFMVRPPRLFFVAVVLLFHCSLRRISVIDFILPGLVHGLFEEFVGRTR